MKKFSRLNSGVLFLYFLSVICITMFTQNVYLRAISVVISIINACIFDVITDYFKDFRFYLAVFLVITVSNPLFVHRGNTVLFYVKNTPITLEAMAYGANFSLSMIAVLAWFRIFSTLMTAEKIVELFGNRFATLGLIAALTLRYVPEFKRRFAEIADAHRSAGLICEDTWSEKVKSYLKIFMSLAEFSFEKSANTAVSMNARGYLLHKRTQILHRKFQFNEFLVLLLTLAITVCVIVFSLTHKLSTSFYPTFKTEFSMLPTILFTILTLIPTSFELEDRLKWHLSNAKN